MKIPSLLIAGAGATGLIMVGALVWMGYELARGPAEPTASYQREILRRPIPSTITQSAQLVGNPTAADTPRGSTSLGEGLEEALKAPGALPNEALLTFKTAEGLAALRARAAFYGLEIISTDPRLRTARVRYRDYASLQRELTEHAGDYAQASPNYMAWVPGLPAQQAQTDAANAGGNVQFRSAGLEAIGAAADRTAWGKGVTVAVLDTGVTDHPSLSAIKVSHVDLVNDGQPFNGHGTAMASLIAGEGLDAQGVAQATNLLDIRIADSNGESNTMLMSSGIIQAVDSGARVINISLGTFGDTSVMREAIQYALAHNVVVVAAAGNEQLNMLALPAGYSGVISVAAVDATGTQAYFSNSGGGLTLAAPGVGIVSAYSGNALVIGSGTSQSTAIVSGVAATVLGWGYQAQNLTQILTNAAKATGAPADQVGAGIIQVPKR